MVYRHVRRAGRAAMRGGQAARNVMRDLYKLVMLGIMTKTAYKTLKNKTLGEKRAALNFYRKKSGMKLSEIRNLKKQVREIAKTLDQERATHVHRTRSTFELDSAVNAMTQNATTYSISALESAMANLRYFDSGTNALVTAAPTSGTYERDIIVDRIVYSIHARNNYQVPCKLTLYAVRPKFDTTVSPQTFFTNGLTDQGNPTATSPLVYLTDSVQFNESYKIVGSKSIILDPGQECSMTHVIKKFNYDFALADAHNDDFQVRYNGFAWIERLEGVLGHDSTADEQGFMQASCDFALEVKYVFDYDAGKDLHDISISDSADTFTNGGLVSQMPVADNQAYSVN